jgi:hypothetical protein
MVWVLLVSIDSRISRGVTPPGGRLDIWDTEAMGVVVQVLAFTACKYRILRVCTARSRNPEIVYTKAISYDDTRLFRDCS